MAGDFLGGLMKGLSGMGMLPQDDPNVKVINAQQELSQYEHEAKEIYAQIGRQAIEKYGSAEFGDAAQRLELVNANIVKAKAAYDVAQNALKAAKAAEEENKAQRTCPECGTENPDGVKFCQECGAKLGVSTKVFCGQCGAQNAPGVKFCGQCGAKLS